MTEITPNMEGFPESESAPESASTSAMTRRVHDRGGLEHASLRCIAYAAVSELTASPHEHDVRPALQARLGIGEALPTAAALDGLLAEVIAAESERLRAEYSGLFEVGSQGPPVPIREDLQTGQRAGTREDLVRFYDYFNYALDEKFAWQPDHLSVELEFMHFLCYRESQGGDGVVSFQLAQADFAGRHLMRWLPRLADSVEKQAPDALYARVMAAVRDFVVADYEWQLTTVADNPNGRSPS